MIMQLSIITLSQVYLSDLPSQKKASSILGEKESASEATAVVRRARDTALIGLGILFRVQDSSKTTLIVLNEHSVDQNEPQFCSILFSNRTV